MLVAPILIEVELNVYSWHIELHIVRSINLPRGDIGEKLDLCALFFQIINSSYFPKTWESFLIINRGNTGISRCLFYERNQWK